MNRAQRVDTGWSGTVATSLLIVIPTYNEQELIEGNVLKLLGFFAKQPSWDARVLIVDSSRDRTPDIAARLASEHPAVHWRRFGAGVGKGKKVAAAATEAPAQHPADVYSFIDADLPIACDQFLSIVEHVRAGANLASATRLAPGGAAIRPLHRRLTSAAGNAFFNLFLRLPVTDFHAGAKAWDNAVAKHTWPSVTDEKFFFDAELLFLAHRQGMIMNEVPVRYVDLRAGAYSKATIVQGAFDFAANSARLLMRHGWRHKPYRLPAGERCSPST